MNRLIEEWKKKAKQVYEIETKYLELLDYNESQREWTYSTLATKQIMMLSETRPDKTKSIREQLNEEQKECYDYLEKVVETNEL